MLNEVKSHNPGRKTIMILAVVATVVAMQAQAQWSLTGNAGTTPGTNFIGTTDSKSLQIKTKNVTRLTVTSAGNVGIGIIAPVTPLHITTNTTAVLATFEGLTGSNKATINLKYGGISTYLTNGGYNMPAGNIGFGGQYHFSPDLMINTNTGFVGIGTTAPAAKLDVAGDALVNGITVGRGAGNDSTNTSTGFHALEGNSTGWDNTAFGFNTLALNGGGVYNTAIGSSALANCAGTQYNTAVGARALEANLSDNNTAMGATALFSNTGGSGNTAVGSTALANNIAGSGNTATGFWTLVYGSASEYNTANGIYALSNCQSNHNTGIGAWALNQCNTGSGNTAIGYHTLHTITTGANNTALGYNADVSGVAITNSTAIGNGAYVAGSNKVRVGNASITSIGGYVNWTNVSDGRIKKNIKQNVPGLEFINKLQPLTYNLDLDAIDNILEMQANLDEKGLPIKTTQAEIDARELKQQIVYSGFIAQDVAKAAHEISYNFSGVDASSNSNDLYGLRYAEFVVPLVKSVQELSKQNEELKRMNADLQLQINEMKISLNVLSSPLSGNKEIKIATEQDALFQNQPNPFNQSTVISYQLLSDVKSASIIIRGLNGDELKTVMLSNTGKGQITINANQLAQGTYTYTLIVNGKSVDTKLMVVTR
ncbi:MAG: tail fiber domain-containing protein [Bacteroidetes bacterium]|nr:tail fiber domain-containing protein [Bacteroidota bacterium]